MKSLKAIAVSMAALIVVSCGSATKNGALIGTGGGAALGALVGNLIGKNTSGTLIGAAVGAAVGGTAGTLIGKHMDKVKAEAAAKLQNANVTTITDANGLTAVKVTFDSGILFASGKADLNANSKNELNNFAALLKGNTDCGVTVWGFTDNDAWRGATAEQSQQKNLQLSQQRADAVKNYLVGNGVAASQITSSTGYGEANPVADNSTAEGKKMNRRVEVYLYASEAMINAANAGTLK